MSTATVNSIAMADIATINGQAVPAGGGGGYQPSDDGLLVWGYDSAPSKPLPSSLFPAAESPFRYQIWTGSSYEVKKIEFNTYATYVLDANGDLYTCGSGTSYNYLGRNSSTGSAQTFQLARTGVDDMAATIQGCIVIESGAMYWTGTNMRYYIGITTSSFQSWTQYGGDTDWISITTSPTYPYGIAGVKGPTSTTGKLYVSGYHNNGRLGNGLTSGTTQTPTLSKTNSTTNFEEYVSHVAMGAYNIGVVTQSGEFYTCGWGNYGNPGSGSSSNVTYMTQVGTDTNWEMSFQGVLGGLAIKGGQLYASSASTSYQHIYAGMTANRTYQLADSDTDWEDINGFRWSASYDADFKGVVLKKNGVWGICAGNDGWNDTKPNNATSAGFTSFQDQTNLAFPVDTIKTVDYAAIFYNSMNVSNTVGIMLHVR